jgi:hypothetical protein
VTVRRADRGRTACGGDAIYFCYGEELAGGIGSLGYGPDGKRIRRKVFGKTRQEVRAPGWRGGQLPLRDLLAR